MENWPKVPLKWKAQFRKAVAIRAKSSLCQNSGDYKGRRSHPGDRVDLKCEEHITCYIFGTQKSKF